MTLADSILWSFARSTLIAAVALWPVAVLLQQMASSRTVQARRVWLLLAVFPFFVPELLIGFNYRLTATQLSSGASPVVAAICTESLYALLQLSRCVAVGVALSLLLPRSEVTRESLYSWDLLRPVQVSPFSAWRRQWLWLRLNGPWQPRLISWSIMALISFQEFETAALMQIDRHPVAWSVWLFDAHAARQPLTDSLRMIVVPLLCEMLLLAPAIILMLRSRMGSSTSGELPDEDPSAAGSGRRSFTAAVILLPGMTLFLLWPVLVNVVPTVNGLLSMLRGTLLKQSALQILTSTSFAAASTFIAMSVAVAIFFRHRVYPGGSTASCATMVESMDGRSTRAEADGPPGQARWRINHSLGVDTCYAAAAAVILPGLLGSLVLSLLLLAAFQMSLLRPLYDTWLPMLLGQSLAVLPKALAVVALLKKTADNAAIHSAKLLTSSVNAGLRRAASSILWRLTTGRWLLGSLVIAHWCFWDVTVASILRPVQLEPVVTRLYNEMHYGRTEALMSLAVLAALTPVIVAGCAMVLSRIVLCRLGIPARHRS